MWDRAWTGANVATMTGGSAGVIERGAVAARGDRIVWVGPADRLPPGSPEAVTVNASGLWMTPGLIDCHTHLVYGGDRADEFEQRLLGASYEEIARRGGGILSTVRATREATEDELVESALRRLDDLLAQGVTTVEVKSGYGLDTETECRMLRAARRLGQERRVRVRTTFLGAHAIPTEYAGRADDYVDLVCGEMLPAVAAAGLADAVDAFCETIAFSREQVARVFERAGELSLPVKLHTEQLTDSGGAQLVARFGGLSADHLEYLSRSGVREMAAAKTVAVLLPGAFFVLRETQVPPVDLLREHGVPIALATDSNPGSSPVTSLLLMMNMGCTFFRLTPTEALAGVTCNAARALGLADDLGTIEPGKLADLALWEIGSPAELSYAIGANRCVGRVMGGEYGAARSPW